MLLFPQNSRRLQGVIALLAALGLPACAPVARVILLPQADGTPSGVVVTTDRGEAVLDAPYETAEISRRGRVSTDTTTADQVRQTFPQLLAIQPMAPERFVMEFESGTSQLRPEELARFETVIGHALSRPGGEIVVIGHTDRQGSMEDNDRLSLQRALAVRALFIERGFPAERIEAVGRGERDPLVPTADEVAEPRNRRAEIVVR